MSNQVDPEGTVPMLMTAMIPLLSHCPDRLQEHSQSPPSRLHHYTGVGALHGIMTTNRLWASNSVFSNDASEVRIAIQLLNLEMDELAQTRAGKAEQPAAEVLSELVRRFIASAFDHVEGYITCFCEDGDLLSQWRGYRSDPLIYSIEFDASALVDVVGARLIRVMYDEGQQRDLIRSLLERWLTIINDNISDVPKIAPHVLPGLFGLTFTWAAMAIKNSAFAEEREWRLVHVRPMPNVLADAASEVRTRPLRGMLIPYVELQRDLDGKAAPIGVSAIRVGPHRDAQLAASGIWHLLRQLQYEAIVTWSQIPVRN